MCLLIDSEEMTRGDCVENRKCFRSNGTQRGHTQQRLSRAALVFFFLLFSPVLIVAMFLFSPAYYGSYQESRRSVILQLLLASIQTFTRITS